MDTFTHIHEELQSQEPPVEYSSRESKHDRN